jgi:hypothetical protein
VSKNQVKNQVNNAEAGNDDKYGYITEIVKASGKKTSERKVWSIGLETTLIPFFVATNTIGKTSIDRDAIGSPTRLAYNDDGSVKFSKTGRPIIKVAKPISDQVKSMRENYIANLQAMTRSIKAENEQAYIAEATACLNAGMPIAKRDQANLDKIVARIEAEAKAQSESDQKLVDQAIEHANAEAKKELVPA